MPQSNRVTRSATARQQADNNNSGSISTSNTTAAIPTPHSNTHQQLSASNAVDASSLAPRKRKATSPNSPQASPEQRRTKRQRGSTAADPPIPADSTEIGPPPLPQRGGKRAAAAVMSSAGSGSDAPAPPRASRRGTADTDRPNPDSSGDTSPQQVPRDSSRRKSSRRKSSKEEPHTSASSAPSRKTRKSSKKDQDVVMKDVDEKASGSAEQQDNEEQSQQDAGADGNEDAPPPRRGFGAQDELDALDRGEDPFAAGYLSRFAGHPGLSSSLRALSGIVSGTHSRLRNILQQLRTKEDPSIQLIALQDLCELLLVSNEDNLAGHFAPDQYVKELVALMQPNEFTGEDNSEIMLLACRCIANMMEALPASTASVVYGGAVPILCQKLLEISYIDLAEQALSTLEKISVEFPSSIVREGGLTACLAFLDFFATSTQRTAVTTAANCCRNIPEDSFPTVRSVMPTLLNTLQSSDQRVVEQASLCVSRVIDSFKYHDSKLEELVSPDLFKAILRLLLPSSTNLIGPNIHTQFLRVLSITARASPRLSVELLKLDVVDTLYQILTGVSPPPGTDDVASKIDKNVIMQAIIRTPREQIFETLNVICELLPTVSQGSLQFLEDLQDAGYTGPDNVSMSTRSKTAPNDMRTQLLKGCPDKVKRFAVILFPTLMHAYTSTVNLAVRQKVLTAQLKMLSNLEISILEEALRGVAYASHLAGILTQQENSSLVTFALQAAELLLKRLESVYRPQFYREGVIAEVHKLAKREVKTDLSVELPKSADESISASRLAGLAASDLAEQLGDTPTEGEGEAIEVDMDIDRPEEDEDEDDPDHGEDDEDRLEREEGDEDDEGDDDDDQDHDSSGIAGDFGEQSPRLAKRAPLIIDPQDIITLRAKRFVEAHGQGDNDSTLSQATEALDAIKSLADQLKACYLTPQSADRNGISLFQQLARHFDGDALESITSYELMASGIVEVLLDIFSAEDEENATRARSDFLEVFMSTKQTKIAIGNTNSPATAFSVLIHKLQEVLSRAEHFDVITVHHNAFESNRGSAASMLAKQLRLRLSADEESGIPRAFRNIQVSIHAIATFKSLEDYLRPRIALSERPRGAGRRSDMTSAMAAYAAAMAGRDRSMPALPALGSSGLPSRPTTKKPSRTKSSKSEASSQPETSKPEEGTSKPRRSSRRHTEQTSSAPAEAATQTPTSAAAPEDDQEPSAFSQDGDEDLLRQALECADEAQLEDDEDDIEADLDALVDGLEEGGLDGDEPDPSAVNLEVANTGKVTAHTEDGARVSTPSQNAATPTGIDRLSAAARLAAARELLSTPTSSSRPLSYAHALQQPPQDWHIEFSINDEPLSSDTTIYRACHFNQAQGEDVSSRSIWSATHTINLKKVQGPAPVDRSTQTPPPAADVMASSSGLPPSLDKHPVTSGILRLMSILHELNQHLDDVLVENKNAVRLSAEPVSQFVNTKLTAKLNRQLEEPLIVASQCLPTWSEDLTRFSPFLFPFETRHLFVQSTSFGYSRLMTRWQNSSEGDSRRHRDERPYLGRTVRQKVRISRSRILESAIKVMELYGSSSSILEVEYFEEVGTGLGPTLEFYSTVSKEFSKKKTKMWRENESIEGDDFAFGKRGLFPAPMSQELMASENGKRALHLFKMLGKFVARSMLDSRIIDVSFNPTFFRVADSSTAVAPSLGAVAAVDEDLAKSLKVLRKYANAKQRIDEDPDLSPAQKAQKADQIRINDAKIDDLALDFTLPGYPNIELLPQGQTINVTIDNVGQYIKKVIDMTLGSGVQKQVEAFQSGFSLVFPYSAVKAFTPEELVMLFGRVEEDWSMETLMDSIKADHGYNLDSKSVRNLLQAMSEFSPQTKRDFLQFVTGSPKLPIGGFKALTPMFTVVCKPAEPPYTSDDFLPSVMTCVNYLKLPNYTSLDVLKEKLGTAIREGQGAFHLS